MLEIDDMFDEDIEKIARACMLFNGTCNMIEVDLLLTRVQPQLTEMKNKIEDQLETIQILEECRLAHENIVTIQVQVQV